MLERGNENCARNLINPKIRQQFPRVPGAAAVIRADENVPPATSPATSPTWVTKVASYCSSSNKGTANSGRESESLAGRIAAEEGEREGDGSFLAKVLYSVDRRQPSRMIHKGARCAQGSTFFRLSSTQARYFPGMSSIPGGSRASSGLP